MLLHNVLLHFVIHLQIVFAGQEVFEHPFPLVLPPPPICFKALRRQWGFFYQPLDPLGSLANIMHMLLPPGAVGIFPKAGSLIRISYKYFSMFFI